MIVSILMILLGGLWLASIAGIKVALGQFGDVSAVPIWWWGVYYGGYGLAMLGMGCIGCMATMKPSFKGAKMWIFSLIGGALLILAVHAFLAVQGLTALEGACGTAGDLVDEATKDANQLLNDASSLANDMSNQALNATDTANTIANLANSAASLDPNQVANQATNTANQAIDTTSQAVQDAQDLTNTATQMQKDMLNDFNNNFKDTCSTVAKTIVLGYVGGSFALVLCYCACYCCCGCSYKKAFPEAHGAAAAAVPVVGNPIEAPKKEMAVSEADESFEFSSEEGSYDAYGYDDSV
eukprot:TRINITY_DN66527_c6_g12_i1.p1 TRINITY_DN66527_c6_g12~~TRINITY_DN66527_c6_g12_i1.p1  ORF type:complete len:297 (-),score=28.99 TRINITY_DN66527_c6_g12_i1:275-1165(-)